MGFILLTFIMLQAGCSSAIDLPEAKVTVKVVDEDKKPVQGAEVMIGFLAKQGISQHIKETAEKGITAADGIFTASKKSTDHIAYSAEKQGYYMSSGEFHYSSSSNGRWQPWNSEVTIVLRKIINPVPMYARKFDLELPEIGKDIGFDLINYDWTAPYGKGVNADIIFHLDKQFVSKSDFAGRLSITFKSKHDGIQSIKEDNNQNSQFKLVRNAPVSNYVHKIILFHKRTHRKSVESNYNNDNNYIYRTRSEEADGKLVRSMYGKIKGDISFDVMNSKTAYVVFDYYLNPDYTTNLEFDPKRNLFYNLQDSERVGL